MLIQLKFDIQYIDYNFVRLCQKWVEYLFELFVTVVIVSNLKFNILYTYI